ncbi:hypothetical protein pb186bvf_010609 [Paramecium bursaria]
MSKILFRENFKTQGKLVKQENGGHLKNELIQKGPILKRALSIDVNSPIFIII